MAINRPYNDKQSTVEKQSDPQILAVSAKRSIREDLLSTSLRLLLEKPPELGSRRRKPTDKFAMPEI